MKNEINNQQKGIWALILLALIYSLSAVVARYLDSSFSPFQQLYIRIFLGLVLGFVFFRKSLDFSKLRKISRHEWLLLLSRSAASFVFGAVLWVKAATITTLANLAFIDALPLTATLSFLLGWEKATGKKVFYLALSYVGIIILSVKNLSSIASFGYGEFLVLVSGFFFAFRNFSRVWHSKLLNDQEITQIMFVVGFVMLFILSFFFGESISMSSFTLPVVSVFLLGGVFMVLNIYLTNFGFARVSLVLGNNILNLEALIAVFVGFLLYREVPQIKELLGGGLVLYSVIKMNRLK